MLRDKSLTQLRGIAQSYSIPDIFSKTADQLRQLIGLKQEAMIPEPEVSIPKPEYDSKLMTRPPSKRSDEDEIRRYLQPYTDRGLHLTFPEPEQWHMRHGKKEDTGTVRQPIRIIMLCADGVMK